MTWGFPGIADNINGGVAFAIFFCAMVGQLVWVLRVMPENKGVPLEEMEAELGLIHDPDDVEVEAVRGH